MQMREDEVVDSWNSIADPLEKLAMMIASMERHKRKCNSDVLSSSTFRLRRSTFPFPDEMSAIELSHLPQANFTSSPSLSSIRYADGHATESGPRLI